MKFFQRGIKRWVREFLPKVFNVVVIAGLILQPVGPAGVYSLALAIESESDLTAPAEEPTPVPEPAKEEEKAAPATESEAVSVPDEVVAPEPVEAVSPELVEEEAPTTSPETPTEAPAEVVAPEPAEAVSPELVEGETTETVPEPAITDEAAATEVPLTDETLIIEPSIEDGQIDAVILPEVKAKTLDLGAVDPSNIEETANLATDKADYAPTDTVLIAGTGFIPGKTYILIISSNDKPPVTYEVEVTANENGEFVYAYQLDGKYRPDYKVVAKDTTTNDVIATTNFTDSSPQITYSNFEGEIAPQNSDNWTNGNISGYKEGDTIRFRVNLDSDAGSLAGHLFIGFTSDSSCRFFKFQNPTNIALDFNRATNAIDSGSGFAATFSSLAQNGNDAVADFALTSSAAKQVRLNFTLQVDDNAAACASGSSQHIQIDHVNGDIKSSGNKALPIPASAVAPVTDITVSKTGTITASIGGAVSYTVTVTNLDTTPASSVVVIDTLPAGITGTTATYDVDPNSAGGTGSCTLASQAFTCNIGTLGGNDGNTTGAEPDVAVITVNGTINNNTQLCSTSLTNNVSVSTTTLESNTQNNSASASTSINACQTTLKLVKQLTNDNGGSSVPHDWTLTATGTGGFSDFGDSATFHNVNATTYTLSESGPTGYSAGNWSCNVGSLSGNQLTLSAGQAATCTITNNDNAPSLTLVKLVNNDNGGDSSTSAWTLTASGPTGFSGPGPSVSNGASFDAGTYTLTESGPDGYSPSNWVCIGTGEQIGTNVVSLDLGESATCTITNDDIAPSLTLIKHVINDDGGNAIATDWMLTATGLTTIFGAGGITSGSGFSAGTYTLSETGGPIGYTAGPWNCIKNNKDPVTGSSVTVGLGDNVICTITNNDDQGSLQIVKRVVNDNGGTADASAFGLSTSAGSLAFGSGVADGANTLKYTATALTVNAGSYTLRENDIAGYSEGTWSCTGATPTDTSINNGAVTVPNGGTVVCTITNNDEPGTLIVHKVTDPDSDITTEFSITATGGTVNGDATQSIVGGDSVEYSVNQGTYSVSEETLTGWDETDNTCSNIEIKVGETKECTITNTKQGHIIVDKVTDPSGDEQEFDFATTGEGYEGFGLTDKQNPNDQGLAPGSYSVTEGEVAGWDLTDLSCTSDQSEPSEEKVNICHVNQGNHPSWNALSLSEQGAASHLSHHEDDYLYGGPVDDDGRPTQGHGADKDNPEKDGEAWCLEHAGDEHETTSNNSESNIDVNIDEHSATIDLQAGETVTCTFTNTKRGKIIVEKQTNPDQSELEDDQEPQAFNFNPSWSETDFTLTDNGKEESEWLVPGSYSVEETDLPDGWDLANTSCSSSLTQREDQDGEEQSIDPNDIALNPGEIVTCTFTNTFTPPTLQISKTNDSGAPETPGNTVLYTITVTAPESNTTNVEDVQVTDLPPAGFTYVDGSATASQGSLTHVYASPGVWSLGTMTPGQTITLTYQATISGSQDAGTYNDLTFARGTSIVDDPVLANESEPTPFVGTDVEVVLPNAPVEVALTNIVERNVDTKTVTKTKRVLGAATTLPYTGANINMILSALMLLLSGLILMLLSKRSTWMLIRSLSKSMMTKMFLLMIFGGLFFAGQSVYATVPNNLSVKIETPQATVSDPNFKIGFVTLDIVDPPRNIEVQCFKNSDVSPFASYALATGFGGNSGDCQVDGTVMTGDGDYEFYVKAVTTSGDPETVESNHVNVKLISGTPNPPLNYSRAAGSCTVNFTTANDGLTEKVELYRSLSSTFTADGTTFVDDVAILPNTAGTITDPNVGDCGGSYFYAIRAVAASGLASDFVGDENVVIDNEHTIKYKTKTTKIPGKTTTLGAIPVTGGGATGAVEGAATTEGGETTASGETGGAVLGETTGGEGATGLRNWIMNHLWWTVFILLILIIVAYRVYRHYGKRDDTQQEAR